jgi:hypothetical protein
MRILELMAPLSDDARARLAFRWLDRSLRVRVVTALRRAGQDAAAAKLALLGELHDREACRAATEALIEVFGQDGCGPQLDSETLTSGVLLLTTLSTHLRADGPDAFGVVVGTATIAACAGAWAEETAEQIADVESAIEDSGVPHPPSRGTR